MKHLFLSIFLALGSAHVLAQNNPTVTSLMLVNAETNEVIGELTNGATINFAELGTNELSIIANTSPDPVGSVAFSLDDNPNYQIESLPPYTIAGDTTNGGALEYNAWIPSIGEHTLMVTPYSESGAEGSAGTPLTIRFTVMDEGQAATEPAPSSSTTPQTETAPVEPTSGEKGTDTFAEQPTPAAPSSIRLRDERFEVVPEEASTLRGSILVADYNLPQTIVTVLLNGTSAATDYAVELRSGCDEGSSEVLILEPLSGRIGLSANVVPLGYDELLSGGYTLSVSAPSGEETCISLNR